MLIQYSIRTVKSTAIIRSSCMHMSTARKEIEKNIFRSQTMQRFFEDSRADFADSHPFPYCHWRSKGINHPLLSLTPFSTPLLSFFAFCFRGNKTCERWAVRGPNLVVSLSSIKDRVSGRLALFYLLYCFQFPAEAAAAAAAKSSFPVLF